MLAWHLKRPGSIENLRLEEVPDPDPGADRLLVKVRGAAVNPADLRVIAGDFGARFVRARRFPLTPGFDFSGTIQRVGSGVSGWHEGDDVFGFLPYHAHNDRGSFAERLVVSPNEIARKPQAASFAEAACSATACSTAFQAIRAAGGARAGQRWLVHGASGGVGSFLTQIGRGEGAEVWGTSSDTGMAYVSRLGAHRVLDHRKTRLADLHTRFHFIFDVAVKSSYHECGRLLKTHGVYLTLYPSTPFFTGYLRSLMSPRSCRLVSVRQNPGDMDEIRQWIDARRLKVPIDSSWKMEDLPGALRRLSEGRVRGKVAVVL